MDRIRKEILAAIDKGTVSKESRSTNGDIYTIQCQPYKKK